MAYYNVWHKERKCWTNYNQPMSDPWRYSLEEAQKVLEYLAPCSSLLNELFPSPWEIREVGEDKEPVPLTNETGVTTMSHKNFDKVIARILAEAQSAETNAGMGGRYDDGGASRLKDQVKFFKYGLICQMPPEWKEHADQITKEEDPEYTEYIRLQKKFKDK